MTSIFDIREVILKEKGKLVSVRTCSRKLGLKERTLKNRFRSLTKFDDIEVYWVGPHQCRVLGIKDASFGLVARKGKGCHKVLFGDVEKLKGCGIA